MQRIPKSKFLYAIRFMCVSALGCIIGFLCLQIVLCEELSAQTYYVATNGSDSNPGTESQPWATFSKAMTVLQPGDTLLIKDGTYYQQLRVNISGALGNPITFKAQNDGKAIIDGQNIRIPCWIYNNINRVHDINLEGVVCKNSNDANVYLHYADRINVKRVSSYGNYSGSASGGFVVWSCTYVLLEDCASMTNSKNEYDIIATNYSTVRRCWGRAKYSQSGDSIITYGSNNNIIENNIIIEEPTALGGRAFYVWAHYYNDSADYNKFYGNIAIGVTGGAFAVSSCQHNIIGNEFVNDVAINVPLGLFQRGGDQTVYHNLTVISKSGLYTSGSVLSEYTDNNQPQCQEKDCDYRLDSDIKNVSFLGNSADKAYDWSLWELHLANGCATQYPSNTHTYNNIKNYTSVGETGDSTEYCDGSGCGNAGITPNYDTSTYGNGAYLIVPSNLKGKGAGGADIGATVLYRYVNGSLTSIPLWPWPMEDRIKAETGYSVTYESGGGLWKTLDGVYGSNPSPSPFTPDVVPPAPPRVIGVQ